MADVLVGVCAYCGKMHRRPSSGGFVNVVSVAEADRLEAACGKRKALVTSEPRARFRGMDVGGPDCGMTRQLKRVVHEDGTLGWEDMSVIENAEGER